MSVTITITNAGRAAIVNAQNTGTAPVTITQIGVSATAHTPAATNTALPGEIKRLSTLSGLVVANDTIHVSVSDTTSDAYALRSFALYLADGTLFAIYGQADPILNKVASSIAALSVDVIFADISAASLTFGDAEFVNPPASATVQGVVELATVAEAQAGIDALRALTPASAKAAILGWLLGMDGAGSDLDADLLDGQQGAWYADVPARLGYTPMPSNPGEVAFFARTSAPAGWLKCDGSAVSRNTYAGLFAVIGTTFGAGNGVTTFNLPDLRGEFLRALDDGRGVDAGRTLGSAQADELEAHRHFQYVDDRADTPINSLPNASPVYWGMGGDTEYLTDTNGSDNATLGVTSSTGGTETRPRNVALLACIKT